MELIVTEAYARVLSGFLLDLGRAVRDRIVASRGSGEDMSRAVAHEGGDTIFAIDRKVEPVIEHCIESWPAELKPLELVAEGMGENGVRRFGDGPLKYRLIIDPIDGTRNIMYDKRSAWFIAAMAPNRGEKTGLADSVASVLVELPPSKQSHGDVFSATRDGAFRAFRERVDTSPAARQTVSLHVRPSGETTLKNGFGQVANFFPGTKVLASELMERIALQTLGKIEPGTAAVFDDQYISTGGQLTELIVGHDRFCADLRPLFYRVLEKQGKFPAGKRGLECHPYDMAGLLVAQRAGVIVTDGLGKPLNPPLSVEDPVHWCGYANESLRKQIEPVIVAFFREHGVVA